MDKLKIMNLMGDAADKKSKGKKLMDEESEKEEVLEEKVSPGIHKKVKKLDKKVK